MKKKILGIALAVCMVLAVLPQTAFAAPADPDDFGTDDAGAGGDVEIPAKIGETAVTGIGESAFTSQKAKKALAKVTIPSTVTVIEECRRIT